MKFLKLIYDIFPLLGCGFTNNLSRNAENKGVGRNLETRGYYAARTYYGARRNQGVIENDRTNPHERSGLDSSAVNDSAMADEGLFPHPDRMAFGGFKECQIQNCCKAAYMDLIAIGAHDCHRPDARTLFHMDISNNADRDIHKGIGIYIG